jgi:hypothetical protein
MWEIKYRASRGVAKATYRATTREEAEDMFALDMFEAEAFGVIITCVPISGIDAPVG